MLTYSLPEHLNLLLSQKGVSRADVYQIFSGEKIPSRDKLIAIAFGLRLSDEEAQKMLKLSGNRELYARDERDALILFALQHKKNIFEINELLIGYNHTFLGTLNQ